MLWFKMLKRLENYEKQLLNIYQVSKIKMCIDFLC